MSKTPEEMAEEALMTDDKTKADMRMCLEQFEKQLDEVVPDIMFMSNEYYQNNKAKLDKLGLVAQVVVCDNNQNIFKVEDDKS
jgi:hypothetical protein